MLMDAWTLAIETLVLTEIKRVGGRLALSKATKKLRINDSKVIGYAHRLVSETLRKKNYIDFLLKTTLAPKTLNDFNPEVRAFLRLYVNETKLAGANLEKAAITARMGRKILGWRNIQEAETVLGEICGINTELALRCLSKIQKIALQTYHPKWFVKYSYKLLGRYEALKFLEKSAEITPIYIRINTLREPEETLLNKVRQEKIEIEKIPQLKHTYRLIGTKKPLPRTKSHLQGRLYIQDKASCLAAEIANPKENTTVLDVCAASGAKTTYMSQLMNNTGEIISIDYSKRRMRVLQRETKRMGAKNVHPIVADARKGFPVKVSADLVVLDPPCTSTGTFGKNPDAKWRLTKRSIQGMAKMQAEMINQCSQHIKTGGFLVYSTCSITLEENEVVIEDFLKHHPEFKIVEQKPRIGLPGLRGLIKCQRLFPHIHQCNGFFVAKLQKL